MTMRLVRFSLVLGMLGFACGALLAQQQLDEPSKEVIVDSRALVHGPIPKWDRGHFLSRDMFTEPGRVIASDESGNIVREFRLSLPDAKNVSLTDTAVSPGGTYAVAGTAADNEGAYAAFIAWFDQNGAVNRVVRTSPYVALTIRFTDDGSLWSFGRVIERAAGLETEPAHETLRQYGTDGVLIDSFLPRATFDARSHPARSSYLVTNGNGVGVYSETAMEWIELSVSDGTIQRFPAAVFPGRFRVTGVAVTTSGAVYVSIRHKIQDPPAGSTETDITAIYRLDRPTGNWLEMTGDESNTGLIFGADGNELIISGGFGIFRWVPVP